MMGWWASENAKTLGAPGSPMCQDSEKQIRLHMEELRQCFRLLLADAALPAQDLGYPSF
jgi:hypothetical protein